MDNRHTVRQLLANYQPTDTKEHSDVDFISTFITHHPECFGKANPAGHITGSAFIMDSCGRVLLTFHRKLQRWLQLGGHGTPTEFDPADTALREAQEESGLLDLVFHPAFGRHPIDIDVHHIPARPGEPQHPHLDFRYLLMTKDPESIQRSEESTALSWKSRTEITSMAFDPALSRAFEKVWALHDHR